MGLDQDLCEVHVRSHLNSGRGRKEVPTVLNTRFKFAFSAFSGSCWLLVLVQIRQISVRLRESLKTAAEYRS